MMSMSFSVIVMNCLAKLIASVVVKGDGEAQITASDWSKNYANHLKIV